MGKKECVTRPSTFFAVLSLAAMMLARLLALSFLPHTSSFCVRPFAMAHSHAAGLVARGPTIAMQTIAPERTSDLPQTWSVPDTFSLSSLRSRDTPEPPMARLTVFQNGINSMNMANALMKVICGLEPERAMQIASTCANMGFAACGIFVEEVAEKYAEELGMMGLKCGVSEA